MGVWLCQARDLTVACVEPRIPLREAPRAQGGTQVLLGPQSQTPSSAKQGCSTGKTTKRTAHLQPKHVGATCSPLGIRPEFSQRQQLKKRDLQRTQLSYDKAKPNGNHKALTAAQERAWPCQARSPRRSSSPRLEQTKRTSRERAGGGVGGLGGIGEWGGGGRAGGKGPGGWRMGVGLFQPDVK